MPESVEGVVETVNVEVADMPAVIVTLMGLNEGVGPAGEMDAAKLIVPLNPLKLVKLMIEVVEGPDAP